MWKYIVTPIIGAIIGYVTNWIAVKMLFRPRKEVRVFGKRLPFTPGVIPRGQARLAKAVGNVVETQLLTPEYMGEKLLSEESEKEFKSHIAMEPGKLIVDKVVQEAQRKLADSMFGMMLGGSFIEKIAGQIQEGIDAYIAENARGYIEKEVVAASEELQAKPIPEVTGFFEEKGIYDPEFLWRLYKRIIEEKLPALLSSLKLSAVVEERINAMKVEEVEELVLSIMSKELGAIVNLGAVIGLILGLVNVLIFMI